MHKQKLLNWLVECFPGFSQNWEESFFKDGPDEYTVHGLFSEFSHFFRENIHSFSGTQMNLLFQLIENSFDIQDDFNNAACTCFLENIAGEGITEKIQEYIGTGSKKYMAYYDH